MFILTPAFLSKVKPLSSKKIKINKSQSVSSLTRPSFKSSSLLKHVGLYFYVSSVELFCDHTLEILIVNTIKIQLNAD